MKKNNNKMMGLLIGIEKHYKWSKLVNILIIPRKKLNWVVDAGQAAFCSNKPVIEHPRFNSRVKTAARKTNTWIKWTLKLHLQKLPILELDKGCFVNYFLNIEKLAVLSFNSFLDRCRSKEREIRRCYEGGSNNAVLKKCQEKTLLII